MAAPRFPRLVLGVALTAAALALLAGAAFSAPANSSVGKVIVSLRTAVVMAAAPSAEVGPASRADRACAATVLPRFACCSQGVAAGSCASAESRASTDASVAFDSALSDALVASRKLCDAFARSILQQHERLDNIIRHAARSTQRANLASEGRSNASADFERSFVLVYYALNDAKVEVGKMRLVHDVCFEVRGMLSRIVRLAHRASELGRASLDYAEDALLKAEGAVLSAAA
jgi:hypothetical protein